jgi:hypothetical protein
MIEALEERESYEADAARRQQLLHLQTEMNSRRDAEERLKENDRVEAAKKASGMEAQLAKLSLRLDSTTTTLAEHVSTIWPSLEQRATEAQAVARQQVLATTESLREFVEQKNAAAAAQAVKAEERAGAAETQAKEARQALLALREGLGLGGLGVEGDSGKLCSRGELESLRQKTEVDIARVSDQLIAAQSEFAQASNDLQRTAAEAQAMKTERLEMKAKDAEATAAIERERRAEAESQAQKVEEEAKERMAAAKEELAREKKKLEADAIKQRQQRRNEANLEAAAVEEESLPPVVPTGPPAEGS